MINRPIKPINDNLISELTDKTNLIRKLILEYHQGYGCLSGALSMVELYTALYHWYIDTDLVAKNDDSRTRVIAKSTSGLAFFSTLHSVGLMSKDTLAAYYTGTLPMVYRSYINGVDMTQYTMGPVLGNAVGLALTAKVKKISYSVICYLSDGALQQNVDQAAKAAALLGLNNLTVIMDCNELQSYYPIEWGDPSMIPDKNGCLNNQRAFWEACGWHVHEINGHDFREILPAYLNMNQCNKPYLILAHTIKGKGIPEIEGRLGYQHKLDPEKTKESLEHYQKLSSYLNAEETKCQTKNKTLDYPKLNIPVNFEIQTNMRETFKEWVDQIKASNPGKIYSIDADSRNAFSNACTEHVINKNDYDRTHLFPGLNERLSITIANGMAHEGLYSVVSTRADNLTDTNEEWNAICMDRLPILLTATRPGAAQADSGPEKCMFLDIEIFDKPGGQIFQPSNSSDFLWILENIYLEPRKYLPAYLRLPDLENCGYNFGRDDKNAWRNGYYVFANSHLNKNYVAIIASGDSLNEVNEILTDDLFKDKIKIINLFNLKRINSKALQNDLLAAKKIYSIIEARSQSISEMIFMALPPKQRSLYEPLGLEESPYIKDKSFLLEQGTSGARRFMLEQNKLDVNHLKLRINNDINI